MLLDATTLRALMSAVDEAFAAGQLDLAEHLDAELERHLDDLDHRLTDLDEGDLCDILEGGDVLDGDSHDASLEDQFIDAWSGVLAGHGSFSLAEPDRLAGHLRAVLRDTALQGPSFPHSFLDHADDETLILLAADLWNERQALILGTR